MVLSDTNFYYQYNLSQTAKKEMKELTIFSWGGGGFYRLFTNPKGGAGCSFLCPQKGGVSYLDSMTGDVLW